MRYYGTVTITLVGEFEADGVDQILDDPMAYVKNASIYTDIEELEELEEIEEEDY